MKLKVNPGPVSQKSDARYLLAPCPPNTSWQSFVSLESSFDSSAVRLVAENASQGAWLFDAPASGEATLVYNFKDSTIHEPCNAEILAPIESPLTAPSDELTAKVREITRQSQNEAETLKALIAFTASLFDYDHPERPFNYGLDRIPMLSQLTRGNCADIHGFLLSCLYAAGIEAGYIAGFCFPRNHEVTRGYHCWLASRCGGELAYWDVAQHVKADITPVQPGLNPFGGRRVAMGIGRGLVFSISGQRIQVPHLGYPMWIYADGLASGLGATAQMLPSRENPTQNAPIEQQFMKEEA